MYTHALNILQLCAPRGPSLTERHTHVNISGLQANGQPTFSTAYQLTAQRRLFLLDTSQEQKKSLRQLIHAATRPKPPALLSLAWASDFFSGFGVLYLCHSKQWFVWHHRETHDKHGQHIMQNLSASQFKVIRLHVWNLNWYLFSFHHFFKCIHFFPF